MKQKVAVVCLPPSLFTFVILETCIAGTKDCDLNKSVIISSVILSLLILALPSALCTDGCIPRGSLAKDLPV